MDGLIEIRTNEDQEQIVSARELYGKLGLDTSHWSRWSQKNIVKDEFFKEGVDYIPFATKASGNDTKDFLIKLDMAKELCMLARTEQGKQIRSYFIQVEKDWNSPDKILQRALLIANKNINVLQLENKELEIQNKMKEQMINELKPKADYTDIILKSKSTVTITQIAKDYGMSGQKMNKILSDAKVQYKLGTQWLLYSKYQSEGYTHSQTINITRADGRPDITMETKWTQKGRLFLYNFLKEKEIIPLIERED